jgi:hypothetical protein
MPLIVGGGLALYRTPFTYHSPSINKDGGRTRIVVRFGWDGNLYHHGSVATYSREGQKRTEYFEYGSVLKWHCRNFPRRGARFWDDAGQEITSEEYFRQLLARQASR